MKLYTIFDKLAGEHGPIFEAKNDLVAARSFAHALKGAPAHDYELYLVGERLNSHLSDEPEGLYLIKALVPLKIPVDISMSADKKYGLVEVTGNADK